METGPNLVSFGSHVATIAREGGSCALLLRTLGVEHEVIFRDGMPVYATPHPGVNDLVSVMLNAKQISETRAMTILASLPASPVLWEQNLSFFDDIVSRGELYGVLESAVRTRLLTLFGFDADVIDRREVPSTTGVPLFRIEPARLVLDGIQSHYSDEALARECPFGPNASVRVRFDAISHFADLTLTPTEMDRLSRLDGKLVSALREEGFQEVGAIRRFICALSLLGIIEVDQGARTSEAMEWAVLESPPEGVLPPETVERSDGRERLAPTFDEFQAPPAQAEAADEDGEIEEIGVVYSAAQDFGAQPSPALDAAPPQRQTLTARLVKSSAPTVAPASASATASAPAPAPALPPAAPPTAKSTKKLSPLFQRFPQIADKDFFSLLGVGRQFQPFEIKNGITAVLKLFNINRFDQTYKGADADLALQLLEHIATAYVTLQDPKYKVGYLEHCGAKKEEMFRLSDTLGKAAVDATVGDLLMKNKVYGRAETYLTRAGDGNTKSAEYQFLIAKNLYLWSVEQGKEMPAKIKGALDNALALDNQYYDAYLYLGYYFKQIGKNDLALRKFKEAVGVNQKGHEAAREIRLLSMRTSQEKKKPTFFGLTLGKKPDKKDKEG